MLYPLSGLDRIFMANCRNDKSAFIIQNYSEISTFVFSPTLYGELSFTATEETFDRSCTLITSNESSHDCFACPFCVQHGIVEFHGMVDKGYKVFYQTWKDLFQFKNSDGSTMFINLEHRQIQPSWDASNIIEPYVDITRYGLRWTKDDVATLKALWEHAEVPQHQEVKIYNPWI
ncbi:hypothetical protein HDV06_003588 [Boothiomyces sp. JEL0866]|nr:hypothetical protein HDV06_003588 [Boothiomyces sp. JEL0866]